MFPYFPVAMFLACLCKPRASLMGWFLLINPSLQYGFYCSMIQPICPNGRRKFCLHINNLSIYQANRNHTIDECNLKTCVCSVKQHSLMSHYRRSSQNYLTLRLVGKTVFHRYNCHTHCGLLNLRSCRYDIPKQMCTDHQGNDSLLIWWIARLFTTIVNNV